MASSWRRSNREKIGPDLFARPASSGWKGLVSKHRDRAYCAGTSPNWLKVKNPAHPAMQRVKDRRSMLMPWTKKQGVMPRGSGAGVLIEDGAAEVPSAWRDASKGRTALATAIKGMSDGAGLVRL